VTDPSGAKVPDALVTLRDKAGIVSYQTRTDAEGRFSIAEVAPGTYTLGAFRSGFDQQREERIEVREGSTASADLKLSVAAISDQIVVSATRTATVSSDLGGSLSVQTAEDLRLGNQSLISEPLRLIPGLSVAQTGGRGGLTSIFSRGGESNYNKVLIDGVPVNAAGGLYDFGPLTTENIERIEIARGPGSALFGSDAMTSVIQLITKRGSTAQPEFELSGEGGSFDFHRETARLSGVARWFDYSTGFGYQGTEGRFRNSDYLERSLSANLGFRLAPTAELRITSRWNDGSLGVPGATAVLFADPDQRQKHQDISLGAGLEWKTMPRWSQTARYIYSEFNTHSFDPNGQDLTTPGTPSLPTGAFGSDFAFSFVDHEKRSGVQYQSVVLLSSSNVFTAGLDFEHESAVFTDDFSRVTPDRNNLGIYLQDQAAWLQRIFLTTGVRIERNSGSVPVDLMATLTSLGSPAPSGNVGFGVTANPKIAASFVVRRHNDDQAFGATRLKGTFGTGIKEPGLDEAFSPSIFFLGNPLLDPERAISFDLGIVQEIAKRRASIELTYFDNRFRDQIAFVFDPSTFGPIKLSDGRLTNFINLERSSARGIELSGTVRPTLHLRFGGSYTFLRSRLDRASDSSIPEIGLPLLRRPRHSGSIEASWIGERFDIRLDGALVGQRRDIDPITGVRFDTAHRPIFNDGYAKLNLAGSYRFNQFLSAFARVENLLNQDYQEVLGYPAYRLNFSAGLRLRIGGGR
jgi:vitamin B12 transporter